MIRMDHKSETKKVDSVVIISGGMDSTVLAHTVVATGHIPLLLTFDYGQRHGAREIECARYQAEFLNLPWEVIDLTSMTPLLKGSSLTDSSVPVPEGHYEEDNMKATVVPNRNAIMLSIAYGAAVGEHASTVYAAVHAGDHAIYPDCRPEFISALNSALILGNQWATPIPHLETPFVRKEKSDLVTLGSFYGVPFDHTWSCYMGGEVHCGACGTCTERIEAFRKANIQDPTVYDPAGLEAYRTLQEAGSVV
jgi:7-cyano-7-deazaguanine synthase